VSRRRRSCTDNAPLAAITPGKLLFFPSHKLDTRLSKNILLPPNCASQKIAIVRKCPLCEPRLNILSISDKRQTVPKD
jgi:hypothetical protein